MWVFLLISLWNQSLSKREGVSFYSETILVVVSKFEVKVTFSLDRKAYIYCMSVFLPPKIE